MYCRTRISETWSLTSDQEIYGLDLSMNCNELFCIFRNNIFEIFHSVVKFSLLWKRDSFTRLLPQTKQAAGLCWSKLSGYSETAKMKGFYVAVVPGDSPSSLLATAQMQEVLLVGYITDLIKWLAENCCLWESWGTDWVKNPQNRSNFNEPLFKVGNFFLILTFTSNSKMNKKYLARTLMVLCGLLQRGHGLGQ